MNIQDVMRETVTALFSNKILERTLVLKGGTALHLVEEIALRLSTDIDFSVINKIDSPEKYFNEIEKTLAKHFLSLNYEVIDANYKRRPKIRKQNTPDFWSEWQFTFKLSDMKNRKKPLDFKRRAALVPEGSNSSNIEIDISEYEYCDLTEKVILSGTTITKYTGILIILEKLRAICQQHPSYRFSHTLKNRARDFYDIYNLVKKYRKQRNFVKQLKAHVKPVFEAKEVPLELLDRIFEPDFISSQEDRFQLVRDTVREKVEDFTFYVEQLRILVHQIKS